MAFQPIDACRSCSGRDLAPVIDLGEQPLANDFRLPDDPDPQYAYPLRVIRCRACSLVQLSGTVPPKELFDTYHYFSSYSDSMLAAMNELAGRITSEQRLAESDLVVEVASNDGYLLQYYLERGIDVLGIEPAGNVAAVAQQRGVPTLVEYFGQELAAGLVEQGRRARVIHANNVAAHVPNINDLFSGIATLLRPDGMAYVETPHLVPMIDDCEFDTIYHEHVFYHSLTALMPLVERHGLVVTHVERIPVHGGSLRIRLEHEGASAGTTVGEVLEQESSRGVDGPDYYRGFADRVEELRTATTKLLVRLVEDGRRLAGYGAAAKGTVLLNHFGIGPELLQYVVDRNKHKQGRMVPGVRIPVRSPAELITDEPDDVLLLAWNLADEVMAQQRVFLDRGGRFIIPVPTLRTVPS